MDEQIQPSKEPQKTYSRNWKKLIPIYLIVGLVVYAGIYYFLVKDKTKPNAYIISTPTVMPKVDSENSAADQENAKKKAEAFYNEWLTNTRPENGGVPDKSAYIDSLEKKGYITKNAVKQIKKAETFDAVSCSQNPLPYDKYKFSHPVVNANKATITLTGNYGPPPAEIVITLELIKSNSQWSIDSITCPPVPTVTK